MENDPVASAIRTLANALCPLGVPAGTDATGGSVESVTEALMGQTNALVQIADAISDLACAVREHTENLS